MMKYLKDQWHVVIEMNETFYDKPIFAVMEKVQEIQNFLLL